MTEDVKGPARGDDADVHLNSENPARRRSAIVKSLQTGRQSETAMDDTKTHQMRLDRVLRHMEADFLPDYNAPARPSTDVRLAYAAEYAAYQLGQINRRLEKLISVAERIADKK